MQNLEVITHSKIYFSQLHIRIAIFLQLSPDENIITFTGQIRSFIVKSII